MSTYGMCASSEAASSSERCMRCQVAMLLARGMNGRVRTDDFYVEKNEALENYHIWSRPSMEFEGVLNELLPDWQSVRFEAFLEKGDTRRLALTQVICRLGVDMKLIDDIALKFPDMRTALGDWKKWNTAEEQCVEKLEEALPMIFERTFWEIAANGCTYENSIFLPGTMYAILSMFRTLCDPSRNTSCHRHDAIPGVVRNQRAKFLVLVRNDRCSNQGPRRTPTSTFRSKNQEPPNVNTTSLSTIAIKSVENIEFPHGSIVSKAPF